MKKLITLLILYGLSLNSYSQIDITKRKVTLDSLAARNDSIYVLSPMTGGVAKFDTYLNVALDQPIDSLTLNPNIPSPQQAYPYKIFADSATNLLGYFLEGDINPNWINVSQNTPVLNNTADTLKALTPVSAGEITLSTPNPTITVVPCRSDSLGLSELFVGIVIKDIPPGKIGKIAGFDFIAQVNTTEWEVKDRLYVSADTSWLTNTRPMAPNYNLFVGTVFVKHATFGVIGVDVDNFTDSDTEVNLEGSINGIITKKQAIRDTIISNVLYFETYNEDIPTKDLPFMYGGMRYNLNTTANTGTNGYASVTLVYGTATAAQTNYIYIDYNFGVPQLSVSTTAFPEDGIRLAECNVYDQATHELYGFGSFQRFNNSVDGSNSDGLFNKTVKRLRLDGSIYEEPGIDPTVSIVVDGANKDSANITTTPGIIWQFNKQTYQAQTEKRYLWLNSPTGERWITDLNEVDSTESGIAIHSGNTNRYGLNIFAIQNSGDFNDFLAVTSPTDVYVSDDNAINDIANLSVTNVPNKYSKVSIRLYRIVLRYQTGSGGTITNLLGAGNYQDERGFTLGSGGSGVGSGGAVSNFPDTDFTIYNNLDPTKISQFDASQITTGTTRTYDFPDKSGEFAVIVGDSLNVTGNIIGDAIKSSSIKTGVARLISNTEYPQLIFDVTTNPTTPLNGWMWYNGTNLNFNDGSATHDLLLNGGLIGITSTNKTFLGIDAGASATGVNNVFLGHSAGYENLTGGTNTFVGKSAGYSNLGSGNVFLGYQGGYFETGSNKLYIENSSANKFNSLIWGDFENDSLRLNATTIISPNGIKAMCLTEDTVFVDSTLLIGGKVGVNNSNPLIKFHITQEVMPGYPTLGTSSGGFVLTGDNNQYGLYMGLNTTTGDSWMQAMRNDAATSYFLLLNPEGGNVGIGTTTPSTALEVDGVITYATKTYYYAVNNNQFVSENPDIDDVQYGAALTITTGTVEVYAPINLPHGAIVKDVIVTGSNSSSQWSFIRKTNGSTTTALISNHFVNTTDDTPQASTETIDNSAYTYYILTSALATSEIIYDATISYTMNEL